MRINVSALYYCVIIFSISLYCLSINTIGEVDGTTTPNEKENDDDDDDTKDQKETMKLKIKLNLNNLDKIVQKLKLVSYVNGEVKEQYIDLLKEKSKIKEIYLY